MSVWFFGRLMRGGNDVAEGLLVFLFYLTFASAF